MKRVAIEIINWEDAIHTHDPDLYGIRETFGVGK